MRIGWAPPLLVLAACTGAPPPMPVAVPTPTFDPIAFFSGRTRGEGRLKIAFRRSVGFHVEGSGVVGRDGTLVLTQTVFQGRNAPRRRAWRIARSPDGAYRGTLSDARGPVLATVAGNRLRIRFAMAHGLAAEQWLVLAPDGQASQNRLTVRKFGIVVARADEHIVRVP